MRKVKGYIALLLSLALVSASMTACGAKTSAAEKDEIEENVVEVDFGNLNDSVNLSEPVQSEFENNIVSEVQEDTDTNSDTDTDSETEEDSTDLSWFDDCVFMGDSLTLGLSFYALVTGDLGNAEFVCAASLGWVNSQWSMYDENEVHPMYNGEKILLEDAVTVTGAKKAIIGLGMNDIGNYGVDETLESADEFIAKLRAKTPDVQIYLQTVTPMIPMKENDRINNSLIKEYDDALEVFAKEHDCKFINSWAALADENGELPYELCEDPDELGLHLSQEGCGIWADCIRENVLDEH